jgi:hypothetical protein
MCHHPLSEVVFAKSPGSRVAGHYENDNDSYYKIQAMASRIFERFF